MVMAAYMAMDTPMLELAAFPTAVPVRPEEYSRLLGYPPGWRLEGRALELAAAAQDWYARHGRPWLYARNADSLVISPSGVSINGQAFQSIRLARLLVEAEAEHVVLAAVGAGAEAEDEAHRRWQEEKPDEYFFLEIYGSAVVEALITLAGAQICAWAEPLGMMVLPHDSPGYAEWNVAEQPQLLRLLHQTRQAEFPARLEALPSGMLRPRKSLLAVFGLTRHGENLRRWPELVPCESCSFGPCSYRRAPFQKAGWRKKPAAGSDAGAAAAYQTNIKALRRWASERLRMRAREDGHWEMVFRYDGTTCSNLGRPLAFDYHVQLGPRETGYTIQALSCRPAAGDAGHRQMCGYLENSDRLMTAIAAEKPLLGQPLAAVLGWRRGASPAGCYCDAGSREHKWGLALETIHYALCARDPVLPGGQRSFSKAIPQELHLETPSVGGIAPKERALFCARDRGAAGAEGEKL